MFAQGNRKCAPGTYFGHWPRWEYWKDENISQILLSYHRATKLTRISVAVGFEKIFEKRNKWMAKDTNFTCNSFQLYLKDPFIFFKSNILNKYSRFLGKREKMPFDFCVILCIHYLLYMYNVFFISQCSIYSSEESKLCVIYLCCRALDGGRC